MGTESPTLIIDLGNTLFSRTQPGAFRRALQAVMELGANAEDAFIRRTVLEVVLTGNDLDTASLALIDRLSLPRETRENLRRILAEPQGDVIIFPNAVRLLERATDNGWRVIAATNAARWAGPIPPELAIHMTAIVSSSEVGLLKQNHKFWEHLCQSHDINPHRCLVIGDDPEADVSLPERAGLLALPTQHNIRSLGAIADWIDQAGPPPSNEVVLFAGQPLNWAGKVVLEVFHLKALLESVTRRRVLLLEGIQQHPATLVRRKSRGPVLVMENSATKYPPLGWLILQEDRRRRSPPSDMLVALQNFGLSLENLPIQDQRHLVSLVQEAKNPKTRRSRISEIVAHLSKEKSDK